MASVKVAVRVRPFNQREKDMDAKLIIQMTGKTTGILNSKANARDENIRYKEFTFDYSYWSHDESSANFASQQRLYDDLGTEVVDCAFEGYNACVFAYGQTGSGKTFTMMGSPENQGLIPRICKALFERMSENSKRGTTHRVQVSYLEIYQERVADLLRERDSATLKVREHPKKGPYVQGLTTCLVTNYGHIHECMNRGNSQRTTAATNMNDVSSRSHAIFTITFVQAGYCDGVPSETVSKIHLVDLAGSERADTTGATGQRLKEGAHINKSLVTLGSVISTLAEQSSIVDVNGTTTQRRSSIFIPYRDSVLTWLLKDSLGGNSKTIMIAAISPADCNYGETLSTLRYANRAKNIINKPTVNEDPNVKLIRELRDEISKLKSLMFNEQRTDMLAQLHEKEAREKELTEEWAGKWREAQAILREQRALGLRKAGPGVVLDSDRPHLVAIDDDPLSTGVTLYHLKEGQTTIGTGDSYIRQDIELKGAGMEAQHCIITFENGVANILPQPGAHVMLNSTLIESPARLSQGCIIFLGKAHVFRFNDPAEAAQLRKGERTYNNLSRLSLLSWSTPDLANSLENLQPCQDEEKIEIEIQRLNLEKEKEQFEKEQEMFEHKRQLLEQAQAKLEAEKIVMQNEHAQQTRQLQEDWHNLTVQQQERELELKEKEKELILRRAELENERQQIISEMCLECEQLQDIQTDIKIRLNNVCQFITSHANDFTFPNPQAKTIFQELVSKSNEVDSLSNAESDCLIDVLNHVKGPLVLQNLVNIHRKELSELQIELNRRVAALSERRKIVELLDQKLMDLVDSQSSLLLKKNSSSSTSDDYHQQLAVLKQSLSSRTQEELEKIEQKKLKLTLNLKQVHTISVNNDNDDHANIIINNNSSGNSCETNYTNSFEKGLLLLSSLSSDTYHTAASICCSPTSTTTINHHHQLDDDQRRNITSDVGGVMSDSGVELRPSPHHCNPNNHHNLHDNYTTTNDDDDDDDNSDLSSNEVIIVSDSQSSSSIENNHLRLPGSGNNNSRKKRRDNNDTLRCLAERINQQKKLIMLNLDANCSKQYLDGQINALQEMQKRYLTIELGTCGGTLSPVTKHPLQDIDSQTTSPIRPLHTGSTSALYSPSFHLQNQRLNNSSYYNVHRSMPSIATDIDSDAIVSICSYYLRGARSQTHYVYEIRISTIDEHWCILRRYCRFRDLYIAMKARYGEKVASIPFPSRQWFANTENVAQSRKRQLEFYLRRLIDVCRNYTGSPLDQARGPITKAALIDFSPFFQKGVFENGKYGTS